ncbi:MAG TPA: hypothetical protein ENK43_15235 [Planctomycetes bacterium]|nr:hypothetical protein [Planctomycetota bacterium]
MSRRDPRKEPDTPTPRHPDNPTTRHPDNQWKQQAQNRENALEFLLFRVFAPDHEPRLSPEVRSELAWLILGEQCWAKGPGGQDSLGRILRRATRRVDRFQASGGWVLESPGQLPARDPGPTVVVLLRETVNEIHRVLETWPMAQAAFFLDVALSKTPYFDAARARLPGAWTRHQARDLWEALRGKLIRALKGPNP